MNSKALEILEFRKVQEMLAGEASTPLGRELALAVEPGLPGSARKAQSLGREVLRALSRTTAPSLYGVRDIRPKVRSAGRGVALTSVDLKEILGALLALDSLFRWLKDLEGQYPALNFLKSRIPVLSCLRSRLDATVDEDGYVRDSASPRLSSIRRSLEDYRERLRRRAEEMTRRKSISQYLQDAVVTVRNGRLVIPVKQEFAGKIQGLVHDQSSSGQTVFLEPFELLEMGNNLKRLQLQERDEIDSILAEVSGSVGEFEPVLVEGIAALAEFDLSLAKARLAIRWKGSFPAIVHEHALRLKRAWHPLLKGAPVPMSVELLQDGTRTVVITGPNMGGKTVALKTCGLISAMALSGMPCPCGDGTIVGDIRDILPDIGDQQSIEESLSTFSAHIANVKIILKEAGPGKLVLIDELGASTDPKEGAALALAVLRRLNSTGALSVVTSHFTELKLEAQKTPGMQNASVEWDPVNLKPTYRLITGRPGRSNAFLVAGHLGLDREILEEAKENMDEKVLRLEELIADLETSSQKAREDLLLAAREKELAEVLRLQYETKLEAVEKSRKETLNSARREASAIVGRARVDFENAVRVFREEGRKASGKDLEARVRAFREKFSSAAGAFCEVLPSPKGARVASGDIVPGATVCVAGFQDAATVLEAPDPDGNLSVRIGAFTFRTSLGDIRAVPNRDSERQRLAQTPAGLSWEKALSVPSQVDLRGLTVDEALFRLDKYLDDAGLAGLTQVRIIHGKGTGALRKAVTEFLASHHLVTRCRLGEASEGGSGATVAQLSPS